MSQLTIYIETANAAFAKNAASAEKSSVSRWIGALIEEKKTSQSNGWPADFWQMAGAWGKDDFADVHSMRSNETLQAAREQFD